MFTKVEPVSLSLCRMLLAAIEKAGSSDSMTPWYQKIFEKCLDAALKGVVE